MGLIRVCGLAPCAPARLLLARLRRVFLRRRIEPSLAIVIAERVVLAARGRRASHRSSGDWLDHASTRYGKSSIRFPSFSARSRRRSLKAYRSLLAIVQQEVLLFDGSVRDNIAYGRHDASNAEVEDAARRANAHEFIAHLPERYDTFIGERGVKLSGGQQQRLAIARALLAGRTTFVIARRLSTIRRADSILLMEHGRIVERGTHSALMARRGLYHDMVVRQMTSAGEQLADV